MLVDDFLRVALSDLNRDLSLQYLEKALPGLSISIPKDVLTQKKSPLAWGCRPIEHSSLQAATHSLNNEWSDSESVLTSDSDWPDWSRWSRRKSSSSSSQTSIDSHIIFDDIDGKAYDQVSKKSNAFDLVPNIPIDCASNCQCKQEVSKKSSTDPSASWHPAKTGFALWVGNLGPKSTLLDLRTLFGSPDLQSIYLIQRTGCAFVNYNTKKALDEAICLFESRGKKLHDHDLVIKAQYDTNEDNFKESEQCQEPNITPATHHPNRFFICKSLLVEDLEQAKQTGLWSTQLRNKERFNRAFAESENTYLVFSANRTSAFYGIARLESPFQESNGSVSEMGSFNYNKDIAASEPEIVFTPETSHPTDFTRIPAGNTVLDTLRGSQFWKATGCLCVEPETEKWTAPAKITWLSSTNSIVPFSRTRQLKNSLNMNKPIKVARDGTEIDPEVGEKLCKMFD